MLTALVAFAAALTLLGGKAVATRGELLLAGEGILLVVLLVRWQRTKR